MSYYLEKAIWSSVFAIPTEVVDKHLKLCGETALKVLLVLLRRGGDVGPRELARLVGCKENAIEDALQYWRQAGILAPEQSDGAAAQDAAPSLTYTEVPDIAPPLPEAVPEPAVPEPPQKGFRILTGERTRLSAQEVNEMSRQDENIAYLLQESQVVLGRTLTPVSTDTIIALYSYYGMAPDLVLMLLQYCVAIGKDNMRYIEKVAAGWLENGVDSHEKAEREILRATQRADIEQQVKKAFGIYDRKLVPSEKKYIAAWTNELGFGMDMVTLAFERAVEQKGKLSFPYINGILSNWSQKGVKTPAQAMKDIQSKAQTDAKKHSASYDIGELEDMVTYQNLIK